MARHRADSSASGRPAPERGPIRSGLDAVPLWTGMLLTLAEAVNRPWFTTVAWLVVGLRSAMAVLGAQRSEPCRGRRGRERQCHGRRVRRTRFGRLVRLFRFRTRRYREPGLPSGRAPKGSVRGGERDGGRVTGP